MLILHGAGSSRHKGSQTVRAQAAYAYLTANPNDVRSASDWKKGLSGVDLRWVPYNGTVSHAQLGQQTPVKPPS